MRRAFSRLAFGSATAAVAVSSLAAYSYTVAHARSSAGDWGSGGGAAALVAAAATSGTPVHHHGPLPVLESVPPRSRQIGVLRERAAIFESACRRAAASGGGGDVGDVGREGNAASAGGGTGGGGGGGNDDGRFDVLVVGGGATGSGVALDAALRGLSVALVERDDFASGSSSRSTKLIHGGVRYLEKAVFNMDPAQLKLVFEALHERAVMLRQAPHLAQPLPTILPCYKLWEVPFYWAGLKFYDLVAAASNGVLYVSKFLSASEARRQFPTLSVKRGGDGRSLKGSIVYYDGQMNDARFNVLVAVTAALHGAVTVNHAEVVRLIKDEHTHKVSGAVVRDRFTDEEVPVHARVVVNATGPFTDGVRRMDEGEAAQAEHRMIVPSSGVHVTLPSYYSPDGMGLIVPKTRDGRVVFMLPWLGGTIAGTTDSSTEITALPQPHESEIEFILDALRDYLNVEVRRRDVLSAWSGIRPLAMDPKAGGDTQNVLREHAVYVSPDGMVSITGGKWTTYRKMAEDALDKAIEIGELRDRAHHKCLTDRVLLHGAHTYDASYFAFLTQHYERIKYTVSRGGKPQTTTLDVDIAKHLAHAYGDQAFKVCDIASRSDIGYGKRLAHGHPYLEAEVVYCAQSEYCESAVDFLGRRTRLAFLDTGAARHALPRVVEILAHVHGWGKQRARQERQDAERYLDTFESGRVEGEVGEQAMAA